MSISHECVWFGSRLTQKIGRQAGPGEEDQLLSLFLPLSLSLSLSLAWSKSPRTQWKPGQGTNAAICVLLFQRERGMRDESTWHQYIYFNLIIAKFLNVKKCNLLMRKGARKHIYVRERESHLSLWQGHWCDRHRRKERQRQERACKGHWSPANIHSLFVLLLPSIYPWVLLVTLCEVMPSPKEKLKWG